MSNEKSEQKQVLGRPSKYNEDIQKRSDDYVDTFELYVNINGKLVPSPIPSVAQLAFKLRVHRATIYEWKKVHAAFSDTLERLNQLQEIFLVQHGLTRGYDSTYAKFLTVNLTIYKDKIETSNTNKEIAINIDKDDAGL